LALVMFAGSLGLYVPGLAEQNLPLATLSAFDCNKIQAPLSKRFNERSRSPYEDPVIDKTTWKEPTAEVLKAQGMREKPLRDAARVLLRYPYIRSFIVIRNNEIVFEKYFYFSDKKYSYNVHSASKSIWGAAIGIAISKGLIPSVDSKISDLLPKKYSNLLVKKKKDITLKHLLTMSSGLQWTDNDTEDDFESSDDWVAEIIKQPTVADPGAKFNYSTGDSHLLSAILEEATPTRTTCEFIHENLLEKIGVVAEHWGRDPQGNFSGGYNLYLTPRELAKFGLLYLNDGVWNGQVIVPSLWAKDSMTPQIRVPPDKDNPEEPIYDYGYNFWLRKFGERQVAIAWGHGGQMIYIIKDLKMVVVFTTNTRWFAQDAFSGQSIIEKYVIPAAE
jgi:CubicO group peptidase (beta-lactamase class C family)